MRRTISPRLHVPSHIQNFVSKLPERQCLAREAANKSPTWFGPHKFCQKGDTPYLCIIQQHQAPALQPVRSEEPIHHRPRERVFPIEENEIQVNLVAQPWQIQLGWLGDDPDRTSILGSHPTPLGWGRRSAQHHAELSEDHIGQDLRNSVKPSQPRPSADAPRP